MEYSSVSESSTCWPFLSSDIQVRESLCSLSSKEDEYASNIYAVGKEILIEKKTEISSPSSFSSLTHSDSEFDFDFLEDGLARKSQTFRREKNRFKKRKVTPLNRKDSSVLVSSSESKEIESGKVDEGSVYSGNIDKGLPHGLGVVVVIDNSSYFGEFDKGKRSGKGVLMCSDGTIYDGFAVDGAPEGIGTLKHFSGIQFQGNFKQGLPHGEVTVTYPGNFSFTGKYVNGELPNKGLIVFLNKEFEGQKYYGECCEMIPHGWGSLEYTKDGFTTMLYGNFVYGKCQGQATLRRSDGLVRMGNCVDGRFVGKVIDKFPEQDSVEVFL